MGRGIDKHPKGGRDRWMIWIRRQYGDQKLTTQQGLQHERVPRKRRIGDSRLIKNDFKGNRVILGVVK